MFAAAAYHTDWPSVATCVQLLDRTPVELMTIIGLLDYWRYGVEFTLRQELFWLRHVNSTGTQRKRNVCCLVKRQQTKTIHCVCV
jgi:hypothetical protein